jgi:hypothetical protein
MIVIYKYNNRNTQKENNRFIASTSLKTLETLNTIKDLGGSDENFKALHTQVRKDAVRLLAALLRNDKEIAGEFAAMLNGSK